MGSLAGFWGSSLLAFSVGLEGVALPLVALTGLLGTSTGIASTCICSNNDYCETPQPISCFVSRKIASCCIGPYRHGILTTPCCTSKYYDDQRQQYLQAAQLRYSFMMSCCCILSWFIGYEHSSWLTLHDKIVTIMGALQCCQ